MSFPVCGISLGLWDAAQVSRWFRTMLRIHTDQDHKPSRCLSRNWPPQIPQSKGWCSQQSRREVGRTLLLVKRRWWEDKQKRRGWAGSRLELLGGERDSMGLTRTRCSVFAGNWDTRHCAQEWEKLSSWGLLLAPKQLDFLGCSRSECREGSPLPSNRV